jgi:hypothetical protein
MDETGSTTLVGRSSTTNIDERETNWEKARDAFFKRAHAMQIVTHDETRLTQDARASRFWKDASHFDDLHLVTWQLGLALICKQPLRIYPGLEQSHVKTASPLTATMVIVQLTDWIHQWGSLKAMASRTEEYTLRPKNADNESLDNEAMEVAIVSYPHTFLRIADPPSRGALSEGILGCTAQVSLQILR